MNEKKKARTPRRFWREGKKNKDILEKFISKGLDISDSFEPRWIR